MYSTEQILAIKRMTIENLDCYDQEDLELLFDLLTNDQQMEVLDNE